MFEHKWYAMKMLPLSFFLHMTIQMPPYFVHARSQTNKDPTNQILTGTLCVLKPEVYYSSVQ